MAKEPKLKVDGTTVTKVLSVEYQLEATADRDGRPTKRLVFGGIKIRRIADDKTTLVNWSKDPKEKNRKSGEIDFFDANDDKPFRTLKWKNGFIHEYDLRYAPEADHVEETVVIQAEEVTCGGLIVHLNWADKA